MLQKNKRREKRRERVFSFSFFPSFFRSFFLSLCVCAVSPFVHVVHLRRACSGVRGALARTARRQLPAVRRCVAVAIVRHIMRALSPSDAQREKTLNFFFS
jgi:hypothetical protein